MSKAEEIFKRQISTTTEVGKLKIEESIKQLIIKNGSLSDYYSKKIRKEIIELIKDSGFYLYFEQFTNIDDFATLNSEIFKYFANRIGEFDYVRQIVDSYFEADDRTISNAIYRNERLNRFFNFIECLAMYTYLNLRRNKIFFEDLFFKKKDAFKVIEEFRRLGYINSDGMWQGLSGGKTELLAAFHALKDERLQKIKPGKKTTQAVTFYKYFGLDVGSGIQNYISKRSLRTAPNNKEIEIFINIFKSIV